MRRRCWPVGATTTLPPVEDMQAWEAERIKASGDGAKFALVFTDVEENRRRGGGRGWTAVASVST